LLLAYCLAHVSISNASKSCQIPCFGLANAVSALAQSNPCNGPKDEACHLVWQI